MNRPSALIAGLAALLLSAAGAAAQTFFFDFESVASGSLASSFNNAKFSFYNAVYAPSVDEFGDTLAGTDHWQIDPADASYPVTVDTVSDWETNAPLTDGNALNAQFQSVIVLFDQAYTLTNFSVTLDNDAFGFVSTIDFLSGTTLAQQLAVNQTIPGFTAVLNSAGAVTGFVLPGSAYYDNLTFTLTAVPEPAAWTLIAGGASLGFVMIRRRRRQPGVVQS